MRETVRKRLIQRTLDTAEPKVAAVIFASLDHRRKQLNRELRKGYSLRDRLQKTFIATGSLFKAEDNERWQDWINSFTLDTKSSLNQVVFGVYDTEGKYWQSRGNVLDPLDADYIISAYEQRTGKWIKNIGEDTESNVLYDITDWYNSNQSLPELITKLEQYFTPERAATIARTESANIASQIALESMKQFGIAHFNVDVAPENGLYPCVDCITQADANPHSIGDTMPPYHPSCRCGIVYVTDG